MTVQVHKKSIIAMVWCQKKEKVSHVGQSLQYNWYYLLFYVIYQFLKCYVSVVNYQEIREQFLWGWGYESRKITWFKG